MLTLFYNKLIYKHWLVKQFVQLDCDVISTLQHITYLIGKIRKCSQPPIYQIEDQINNYYLVYNDIVFKVWHNSQFWPRYYNSHKIRKNIISYDYTYDFTFITRQGISPHCYLTLTVDPQLSNIDYHQVIKTNNDIQFIFY